MGRRARYECWNESNRHLLFDGIKLVPVNNGEHPYTDFPDHWHVHGRKAWVHIDELTRLAEVRDVSLRLVEMDPDGTITTTTLH